jgi:hypothetical protein
MTPSPLPDQTYLRECFSYAPKTGELRWNPRPIHHFVSARGQHMQWARDAGKLAGTPHSQGCGIEVGVRAAGNGRKFLAHRIIWKLVTGKDPINEIDHKDNNPMNNRWNNLREATRMQNNQNTRAKRFKRTPSSRHYPKGAYQHGNKFFSVITANKKRIYLGTFITADEAHKAYVLASRNLHGSFANAGH